MMKFKLAILSLMAVLLSANLALAASTPLNEFNWDAPKPSSRGTGANTPSDPGGKATDSCSLKCVSYSAETTECGDGEALEACSEVGCGNLFKCVATPCAQGFSADIKDCNIEIQEDNFLCTKCMEE